VTCASRCSKLQRAREGISAAGLEEGCGLTSYVGLKAILYRSGRESAGFGAASVFTDPSLNPKGESAQSRRPLCGPERIGAARGEVRLCERFVILFGCCRRWSAGKGRRVFFFAGCDRSEGMCPSPLRRNRKSSDSRPVRLTNQAGWRPLPDSDSERSVQAGRPASDVGAYAPPSSRKEPQGR